MKETIKETTRQLINTPLAIGNREIPTRLILAPMSGLTHVAFRELVDRYGGCGLLATEMCSAKALPIENRHVSTVFRWRDAEASRLVCQIFGSDPEIMVQAARRVEAEGFFGVDLNFGCSVAPICKKNCGAALLRTPDLAVKIVRDIRQAVSIPVTVKFRTGWEDRIDPAADLARRFEDAGADALTFHPRVAPDRRSRPPKWEYIRLIKQAVQIPVFGNGEVFTFDDCEKMFETTGCDGIALGRIAIAKPWVFAHWTGGLGPTPNIYRESLLQLMDLMADHFAPPTDIRKFKKLALYPAALFKFGHSFFTRMFRATDFTEMANVINAFFDTFPEEASRPNLNLFR
ncbi:MAG: tRNA-dihydrouridine synthase family protein [Desulfosalsimonadaceae bacterium]